VFANVGDGMSEYLESGSWVCVAVWCSVLQCVAVLQCSAVGGGMSEYSESGFGLCCSVLQCGAVLQGVALGGITSEYSDGGNCVFVVTCGSVYHCSRWRYVRIFTE